MPQKHRKTRKSISVQSYSHEGKKRINNPPVGLVSTATDALNGKVNYQHDPHIEPYLSWAGKKEGTEIEVQNVSLHIHERIDPQRIVKAFLKEDTGPKQFSLFEQPENEPPLHKAIDFYKHEQDWTNRLIAGDSLLVMNSLLAKEGMAGKVQMVYIDPPYGIKYNSNFQPFVNKRDVKDRDEDIPAEPEMIQAFRDTWQLGIHSYLTHLRDRLLLTKELLHESGSCFVQISDENIHHVKEIMDEVFGKQNFVSLITFKKRNMPLGGSYLESISDYIIWYAKDKQKLKYHPLFYYINTEGDSHWNCIQLKDGTRRKLSPDEINNHKLIPKDARLYRYGAMFPAGTNPSGFFDADVNGKIYKYPPGRGWKTNRVGFDRLISQNRIEPWKEGKTLGYVLFSDDYPVTRIANLWEDAALLSGKIYVVQTSTKAIERCLLMSTDPGDLAFDPTCGSGTTAFVAEQWGRRWITCDTSRVAVTLAKQRLMTAKFEYYLLAHPEEGIKSGFRYNTVPHITFESIANAETPKEETLYDQPYIDKSKVRIAGPFTVEAVPSLRVKPIHGREPKVEGSSRELSQTGETGNQALWRDELKSTGIRATGGKTISFSRVEPMLGTHFLHAQGEILEQDRSNKIALISFGPDYGPIEQRQVEEAVKEARTLKIKPDFVVFAAFHFDPEAAKDIDQIDWPGVIILKVQMSGDLLTKDLRKKRSSDQSYWLIGQPDVEVIKTKDGKYQVKVLGFGYYDPVNGEIISRDSEHIAMWFLDTDV